MHIIFLSIFMTKKRNIFLKYKWTRRITSTYLVLFLIRVDKCRFYVEKECDKECQIFFIIINFYVALCTFSILYNIIQPLKKKNK